MNHFLHPVTWKQYGSAALLASVIYYLIIFLRHYRPEIQNLKDRISGSTANNQLPEALQYHAEAEQTNIPELEPKDATRFPYEQIPGEDPGPLLKELKACIGRVAGKSPVPATLIPELREILQSHPELAGSPYRQPVNETIVRECERTGTALLHEDEVDQWWSD